MPAHGIEIERKYLLDRLPPLPPGAEQWAIEQGYLLPAAQKFEVDVRRGTLAANDVEFAFGRLRRTGMPDGSIVLTHTVKTGSGVRRSEHEREITAREFELHWPRTEGRRIRKTRWRVPHGDVVWEIDDLENGWIALAEVELETPDQPVSPPGWLAPHIVREVTDDPSFTNSALAERLKAVW